MTLRKTLLTVLIAFTSGVWAMPMIVPPALHQGDTIGIVATAYSLRDEQLLEDAVKRMKLLGLKVKLSDNIHRSYGYLAGTDQQRADAFNAMFKNPKVNGIIGLVAGWGSGRMLGLIDYDLIRKHPKVIMGFSDFTAVLLAIHAKTGLITFHGPLAASAFPKQTTATYFREVIMDGKRIIYANPVTDSDQDVIQSDGTHVIRGGVVTGELIGGNLVVLSSLLGSPYLPSFKGSILFVEDVGEDAYKIDRMMSQLKNAGVLKQIAGFVFGGCVRCTANTANKGLRGGFTVNAVLDQYIRPLHIPAYTGAMFGHQPNTFILPEGLKVRMDASKGSIQMLQAAVR